MSMAAAMVSLVACSGHTAAPRQTTTRQTTAPATPSITANLVTPSITPSNQAAAAALLLARGYFATTDKIATDADASLDALAEVMTAPELMRELGTYEKYRGLGYRQSGLTTVDSAAATSVDLTNNPAATPAKRPTVVVRACVDVSKVQLRDHNGKPVTLSARPDFYVETLTVVNVKYPSPFQWRVSSMTNAGAASCESS